jgi:methylmalonyl-CoA/ethylmalonyl-CoA epimerase
MISMKRYSEQLPAGIFRRLDHLGLAVEDLEAARIRYVEILGFKELAREQLPAQGVEAILLDAGNCRLELLAPLGEESPIARFIDKRGEGLQQAAFEVVDMSAALSALAAHGIRPLAPPSRGAGGLTICFLHPRDTHGVLLELVEYPRGR